MSSFIKRVAAIVALVLAPIPAMTASATASTESAAGIGPVTATYRIYNHDNRLVCLDIPRGSTANHKPVQVYNCNGGLNQLWDYVSEPGTPFPGYGYLVNRASGKCADVKRASTVAGAPVEQYTCYPGTRNQLWTYDIITLQWRVLHSGQCLVARVPGPDVDLMQDNCTGPFSKRWDLF
ncbi:RICIN domain-containing protein [Actinokineospora diospyrosa]|uniref:Ricin-type beta-trefoil lectin domain-containing protein n=1 Tax=Actinokineospora diospyrosa TaxID=103728 RepID=A0ABT1I5K3_9PSEU|nr:RICIN domain-containing protein [Actinokineospora diospyrosa]MCP2267896.1 Ricin-type beta-trefoil lectin domain-containing protein [Actinokineospora diospyrosa]